MDSITLSKEMLKEFLELIDDQLGALVGLPECAQRAVNYVKNKTKEVAQSIGIQLDKTGPTNEQGDRPRPTNDQNPRQLTTAEVQRPEPEDLVEEIASEPPKRTRKRRRRVSNKTESVSAEPINILWPWIINSAHVFSLIFGRILTSIFL